MTVELDTISTVPPVIELAICGKLESSDDEQLAPRLDELLQAHGKARVLVWPVNFEGWSDAARWADAGVDAQRLGDVERLAVVGEQASPQPPGLAEFCKPFEAAERRDYAADQLEDARQWLGAARARARAQTSISI